MRFCFQLFNHATAKKPIEKHQIHEQNVFSYPFGIANSLIFRCRLQISYKHVPKKNLVNSLF